jgi:xanthine dehydrogenase large subunit
VADASRNLRHDSAVGHVTGAARYVDDTAQRRKMLDCWPVMAPHARAKILRRDATKARQAPGVHGSVCWPRTCAGEKIIPGRCGTTSRCSRRTRFCFTGRSWRWWSGESVKACRAAAALVEVEYEPLPALVGLPAAVAAGSFHTEPHTLTRGDCAAALATAPERVDGEFDVRRTGAFLPRDARGRGRRRARTAAVTVNSSTQHPSEIQAIVAEVLHVPRNKVVVQAPRMGGGFGGKETQGNAFAALTSRSRR